MFTKSDLDILYDTKELKRSVRFNGKQYYPFTCRTCGFEALTTKQHRIYCRRCYQDYKKWFQKQAEKIDAKIKKDNLKF